MNSLREMNEYLEILPYDTEVIYLNSRRLINLPNLNKFTNIKKLQCSGNKLTELNNLPNTLVELCCSNNQ